ncbi:MAG: FAD-dependent oxidoreductase, partial [Spirochaetales bacterium]|nr:FAD-dependent oxidoreductase [Spirochaetales bacterium]
APSIPGLEEAGYLTNETVFSLTELPKSLAVIGAGPIGCEMAQAFARFGSTVHLLEISDHVLPREPIHIADILESALSEDNINLLKNCSTTKVELSSRGKTIHYTREGTSGTIVVDEILVSVGRAPNIERLGLDKAGVKSNPRTGVAVNQYLQTGNKRIYAAGDICSEHKFTHTAEALAAIVIQNALFFRSKKTDSLTIPWSIYADPEVAHVGLYPAEAAAKGIDTDTYSYSFNELDRAILDGDEDGLVEIYTKLGSDIIVGGTIVSPHAGEMISEITLAMAGKLGLGTIAKTIHPYPTQAEGIRRAAKEYFKSRLTPRVKNIMIKWMKWHR